MRLLLATPPMTQLNTPYPATAYLSGFLRQHKGALGLEVMQCDPALELFLRIFSRGGLERVIGELEERAEEFGFSEMPAAVSHFLAHSDRYAATVDAAISFLKGGDDTVALRIVGRDFLPEGPRFEAIADDEDDPLAWAFGELGTTDRAKHIASLFVDDIADAIRDGLDERFELSRYGERLAASEPTFDPLRTALLAEPTLVDRMLDELTTELIENYEPDIVGLTVPFPGNVYGAFRMAKTIKEMTPDTHIVLGGGYVNTELRELSEPRVFDYVDFITLDDGERPLLCLLERLGGNLDAPLCRTFLRRDGQVVFENDPTQHDVPLRDCGTPTYAGLPLPDYVSLFEMLNPMHRLWSDERWNKLTVAHGCYWKKCTFCDVSLDYISRYDPASATLLVDRIETLVDETGQSGFHFVDEAAPPAVLRALANELIARDVVISWWGNIRFEKTFTPDLAALLAESGCVAISGGLEVASNRLLKLMQKGVTVEQVARVTRGFADAGVLVHAYLMYGFPTQSEAETLDSLERVRQLFAAGCIQSGFWHRFAATVHSPIGLAPDTFGIRIGKQAPATFARNDLPFRDPVGADHDTLGVGLRRAIYNYMHGTGLDLDVREWWSEPPTTPITVAPDLVERALQG